MITVVHDGETALHYLERCCFCRAHTHFWFIEKDVACCERCATAAEASDVPEKSAWIEREVVARVSERRRIGLPTILNRGAQLRGVEIHDGAEQRPCWACRIPTTHQTTDGLPCCSCCAQASAVGSMITLDAYRRSEQIAEVGSIASASNECAVRSALV